MIVPGRARDGTLAVASLLAAVVLWSASLSVVGVAVESASPGTVTFWRCVVGTLVLGAWVGMRKRRATHGPSPIGVTDCRSSSARRSWCWAAASGVACGSAFLLIAVGMQTVGSGPAGIVLSLIPGLTIMLAALEGTGHGLDRRHVASLGLGGLGALTLAVPSGGGWSVIGLAVLALAAFAHAATNVTSGHSLERLDPTTVAAISMGVAALVSVPFATFDHAMPVRAVLAIVALGVLPSGLAYVMYFHGIQVLGPERAAYSNFLVPPVAVVAGLATFGEVPDGLTFLALMLAMLALYVGIGGRAAPGPLSISGRTMPAPAPPNVAADVASATRRLGAARDRARH